MLDGIARKVGLGLSLLTLLPWLMTVVGFGLYIEYLQVGILNQLYFPHLTVSLGGIPLIILAAVHAIITHPLAHKILQLVIIFFSTLFVLCLGMIAFLAALGFYGYHNKIVAGKSQMLIGSILAGLSWSGQMTVWTFYHAS